MSANFYNRHRKLISVILVAVFVVGGVGGVFKNIFASGVFDTFPDVIRETILQNIRSADPNKISIVTGAIIQGLVDTGKINPENREGARTPVNDALVKGGVANNNLSDSQLYALVDNAAGIVTTQVKATDAQQAYAEKPTEANLATVNETNQAANDKLPKGGGLGDIIGRMFSWILYSIAAGLGYIFMLVTQVMLYVGSFNTFLDQPAVKAGWVITRDICNNFFIVFMMIMAIGSILQIQTYAWRAMLPKIILSAVLINFSMMFTGILIDLSQVIMLTFAAPLATTKAYSIILGAFGLPDAQKFSSAMAAISGDGSKAPAGLGWGDIIAALMFAILVTIVALCVTIAITCVLVYRIVMLWFLVILSPLWIFGKAFDKLGQVTSQWMSMFSNLFIVGPAMMFFIYLSFLTMSTMSLGDKSQGNVLKVTTAAGTPDGSFKAGDSVFNADKIDTNLVSLSKMGTVDGVINFLIICGLLFGSLMMGQKFGGAGAKFATQGMGWVKKFSGANLAASLGAKAGKAVVKAPGAVVGAVGAKVGTGALGLTSAATKGLGKLTGSTGLQKLGEVGSQWRQDVLGGRRKARIAKLSKFASKIGMGSDEMKTKWGEFTDTDLAKRSKAIALGTASVLSTGAMALATGGAGLIPGLATAAAAYFGGGGRLVELALGQRGISRAKKREEEQKKIDETKKGTAEIVATSEEARDKDIEKDTNDYFNDPTTPQRLIDKNDKESAIKWMNKIEDTKITNKNKFNGKGLDRDLQAELSRGGWVSGSEITSDMLENAKTAVKASGKWTTEKAKVDNFETKHRRNLDTIADAHETEHVKRVNQELDDKKIGKTKKEQQLIETEKTRFNTEYTAGKKLKVDTDDLKSRLKVELGRIDSDVTLSTMQKIQAKQKAQSDHDKKISDVNQAHAKTIETVQHKAPQPKAIDKILEDFKPYAHENWVSQGVAKDAQKMMQTVKDLISAMEGAGSDVLEGFDQLSKGSFYSNNGQTETQFKSIKAMTESTKAMQNLIDALSSMPSELSGQQAQLVKELKQGIAAFQKGGGDTSKLTAIITLLDAKKGKNKEGKMIDDKTVSEYVTDIKPKK